MRGTFRDQVARESLGPRSVFPQVAPMSCDLALKLPWFSNPQEVQCTKTLGRKGIQDS